jgi:cellulose synthase/poly-beta-1,6-N-acetylglucosamine synthase-like glycosyltransferase
VLYPWILNLLSISEQVPSTAKQKKQAVDILIAAYNEESVIQAKLKSIIDAIPTGVTVRILVGSDGSDDKTDHIVSDYAKLDDRIYLMSYARSGKTSTVNTLMNEVNTPLVILTDANVMFTAETISALLSPFSDKGIGMVGADIRTESNLSEGIAHQEREYLQRENRMKHIEGLRWGTMMGAFGGCYAIRTELFRPVPTHFLVDDFHISMSILDQGYEAILARDAVCFEDVSSKLSEEFRRKLRMSTGNFQNLSVFYSMMFRKRPGLSFSFISHKVLRWLTPVFIIAALSSSALLASHWTLFKVIAYLILLACLSPLIDMTLKSLGLKSRPLRFVTYFVSMNAALLLGMFRSFTYIEKATWEPTERNL